MTSDFTEADVIGKEEFKIEFSLNCKFNVPKYDMEVVLDLCLAVVIDD